MMIQEMLDLIGDSYILLLPPEEIERLKAMIKNVYHIGVLDGIKITSMIEVKTPNSNN